MYPLNKFYFSVYFLAGCSGICYIYVVSAKNLSLITRIPTPTGLFREITFIRTDTLMLAASFNKNQTLFFDVTSNYTTTLSIVVNSPCGLNTINDSFIYIASWTSLTPVSTLIFSNNSWSLSTLPNTTPSGSERIFQTTIDSCGRLWLAVTGYGIRIFDPWGHTLLYEWPVSSNINGFLLLENYELFVTDFNGGQILHFNPNIEQCTS